MNVWSKCNRILLFVMICSQIFILWFLAITWCVPSSKALVINDVYFSASGGNLSDVAGTVDTGYQLAREASFAIQYQAVATIGHCTGTWIGNDPVANKSYFLTAAHCFDDSATLTSTGATFRDYHGNVVASGIANFHVPPERVNRPPEFGGALTDIGIIELSGLATLLGDSGQQILRPLIYDGNQEFATQMHFAGYGLWGIGSQGSDGSLFPSEGVRRASGTNTIDSIFEQSHGIAATYNAPRTGDATKHESAVPPGDSVRLGGSSMATRGQSLA